MWTTLLVLGVSSLALPVLSQGTGLSQAGNFNTSCTWCAQNAGCDGDGNTCECSGGFEGRGDFLCYKPDQNDVCTLCNDPQLLGFGGPPAVKLDFLDAFLFSQDDFVKGNLRYEIITFVSGGHVKGKVFPQCIVVIFKVYGVHNSRWLLGCTYVLKIVGIWNSSTQSLDFEIRWGLKVGTAYSFPAGNRVAVLSTAVGAPKTKVVNHVCGCSIKLKIERGNIFVYEVLNCVDWEIGFRPFIKDYPWVKSGVYVKAEKRDPLPISTLAPPGLANLPVCLFPGLHLDMVRDILNVTQTSDAACWLAALNIHPEFSATWPLGSNLARTITGCSLPDLARFFNNARDILNLPPVLSCISDKGTNVVRLFDAIEGIAHAICSGDEYACEGVSEFLNDECASLIAARQNDPAYSQLIAFATNFCGSR